MKTRQITDLYMKPAKTTDATRGKYTLASTVENEIICN